MAQKNEKKEETPLEEKVVEDVDAEVVEDAEAEVQRWQKMRLMRRPINRRSRRRR